MKLGSVTGQIKRIAAPGEDDEKTQRSENQQTFIKKRDGFCFSCGFFIVKES